MNETIKRLAEKSGLSHMPSNYPDMADLYKGADFELEKFAESIVRQCGFELVDESLQYNSPLIQEFTVKVANRLKVRFGVDK